MKSQKVFFYVERIINSLHVKVVPLKVPRLSIILQVTSCLGLVYTFFPREVKPVWIYSGGLEKSGEISAQKNFSTTPKYA